MLEIDLSAQTEAVRRVLANHGIRSALALLNDRATYRYTALYKLIGETMHATHVYDRQSEYRTWLKAVPLDSSFCQWAIREGEFLTHHASADPRLTHNRPLAGLIESYYGRVLRRRNGTPWGTFIHFDLEPRAIAEGEVRFLQEVTPLFLDYLD
ncbi:hypothetical protein [Variovorax sp. JS1663]|uniref:hypothetical protein n=1 Tax=Variovorax sp. JS1663 TaxID=1851577 RepID=UPI000B34735A|nr:hypothetical protein [Variovorax sp. JS1663]OUL99103.1 hypothetical protein A8M77_28185 [Variovorax sp. JS1663]